MCHRTANRDIPENTLDSLAYAARMGCSVIEVDLRLTLDRKVVLNHDGFLERLTNGMGEVETTYSEELALLDAGAWMSNRFRGLRIPTFSDALQIARERRIGLVLDLKDKGMGPAVFAQAQAEGMLSRVRFGGEPSGLTDAQSRATASGDATVGIEPPVTREKVQELHNQGKVVVANFSANAHEMDLSGMRSAVAAGVDWINVDYPRFGAEAIGQPVEAKVAALIAKARGGNAQERASAILELAHYDDFPLQTVFERWLHDQDAAVSHAAALALLMARPATPVSVFLAALVSKQPNARRNAAWAIGMRSAPLTHSLLPLLNERDAGILQETLLALSRCPGDVPARRIQPFLTHADPLVRGAAALALARHEPEMAAASIQNALISEEEGSARAYKNRLQRGKQPISQAEIDIAVGHYRALMKMIESASLLNDIEGRRIFEREAFRSTADYSATVGPVAAYQLRDRIGANPRSAVEALASTDIEVANRAEWTLTKASGSAILPAVRQALTSPSRLVRERAIRILAWREDAGCLPLLRKLRDSNGADPALIDWATEKIQYFMSAAP
jgi:glycerophosphoryl diester phosphodiesterase/HEAT repeat protein